MEKKHTQFYWIYVIVTLLLVVGSVVFIIMGLTVETGKDGGEDDSGTVGKGRGYSGAVAAVRQVLQDEAGLAEVEEVYCIWSGSNYYYEVSYTNGATGSNGTACFTYTASTERLRDMRSDIFESMKAQIIGQYVGTGRPFPTNTSTGAALDAVCEEAAEV